MDLTYELRGDGYVIKNNGVDWIVQDTFLPYTGPNAKASAEAHIAAILAAEAEQAAQNEEAQELTAQTAALRTMVLDALGVHMDAETVADAQSAVIAVSGVEITAAPSGKWSPGEWVERHVSERDHGGKTYLCERSHMTQAGWEPDVVPALWSVKGSGAGTVGDPIEAARGMTYTYGLYYIDPEDKKLYRCARSGEKDGGTVVLHYLPHEVIGNYFVAIKSD